jgi:hypothetical protein
MQPLIMEKKIQDFQDDANIQAFVKLLLENYLSIVSFEHRKKITKLRISAHKLQIEVGRYQGTLPQNRVCHRCNTGVIDDEIHYLKIKIKNYLNPVLIIY